jgi:hypothetical protein
MKPSTPREQVKSGALNFFTGDPLARMVIAKSQPPAETTESYLLFRKTMIPSPIWLLMFGAVIGFSWLSLTAPQHLITRAFG